MAKGNLGDGMIIGMNEGKGKVIMIPQDIDDRDSPGDEFLGALASGIVVDSGDDAIDSSVRGERFNVRRP